MIDERTLTDAGRCPSCGGQLAGSTSCPACAVDLSGPTARDVWQLSVQAAGLLAERNRLIAVLRVEATTRASEPATAESQQLWTLQHPTRRTAGVSESTSRGPVAPPAPEWTRRKVQNLLLCLGVGLLAVAAVIFLVVSWSVLGIGGRAAVLGGATVLAGGGAALAQRRGLGATAEAVSLLTVGLGLLDALGARSAGLAGLDDLDGLVYWAGATAVVAALAAVTAVAVPTRSLRVAAAVLGLLPGPLLTAHLADGSSHPVAVTAIGLTICTVAAAGLAARWPASSRGQRDARLVVGGGAALSWLVASGAALAAAYGEAGSLLAGTVALLVLAGLAASTVLAGDRRPALATAGLTAAAGLVVAASWSVPVEQVSTPWLPVVLSGVACLLLVAAVAVPRPHRMAPALVAFGASVAPGLAAVIPAGGVLLGQLGWLDRPWQAVPHGTAREMLTVVDLPSASTWGAEIPVLLACLAVAFVLAERLHGMRPFALAAVPLAAIAASTLPLALDVSFAIALWADLALAATLVLPGAWLLRRRRDPWGSTCVATGLVGLGLAVAWSLALQSSTLVALAIAAALLAGGAVVVGAASRVAALRLVLGVAATLSAVAEAAALARAGGAGWPAVWSLALGLATLAASAAAVLISGDVRRALVVVAAGSVLGEAAALTMWGGGSVASAGLAVTVTAGALAAAAMWLDALLSTTAPPSSARAPELAALGKDVATTEVLGGLVGVVLSASDADRLWLALLAAGVAAAVVSLRSGLHRVGWVAGALIASSSWVRLALSDVDAPEPYTVPAGVALVALGWWRRRADPAYPSWRAYGAGLGLVMAPSLVRALTDAGNLRPMVLGLVAFVVLCSGIARRLKAPLVIGAAVLAVDALVQLSPYLVMFYAAVPRWSLIAVTGLALVGVGVTYESRARELRAVHEQISRFG